jgi:transposase
VFFDEFGFSFLERLGPTWAPRGHPPILRRVTNQRREISTAVGLTVTGKIYKRHFHHSIKGPDIVVALDHIRRHVLGCFILVWDRGPTHTARLVSDYLAAHPDIRVEWLPGYAPELNPEEYCHGNAKTHLKNATPDDKRQVCEMLDGEFARIRHRPDLILGFFHHAGLPLRQLWLV